MTMASYNTSLMLLYESTQNLKCDFLCFEGSNPISDEGVMHYAEETNGMQHTT